MRAADLDLRELLDFDADGGVIRFGGERVVILDAVALGILRSELWRTFGATTTRAVLTAFGWAHGWRTAEALEDGFPWDTAREWRIAGGRLHALQGQVVVEPVVHDGNDPSKPFGEAYWRDSYEAEQHLLFLGRSEEPVCWTLAAFASGYGSYCNGRAIYYVEDKCRGRGDEVCHLVGRPREEWGPEVASYLRLYDDRGCLQGALDAVTEQLKVTEQKLRRRRVALARVSGAREVDGLVSASDPMRRVVDLARRIAKVDSTVLITGESGAGKERIARLIHAESARIARPLLAVNCGAITDTLLESELFGHVRGAFTGATHDRAGLFESADGGTLLLDEIGEVSAPMQVKLLRALQEHEVRRVGESKSRKVDVRVIAATNRDLARDVDEGRFRKDLYYRLRVVELRVPPLRERKADVLPLARVLLGEVAARMKRTVTSFSPAAAERLLRYDWPGNVRELENVIERAVALTDGARIGEADLPDEVRAALPPSVPVGKVRRLDAVERDYILAVYQANGGNQARTAEQLGIGTATLYRKLKAWRVLAPAVPRAGS